MELILELPWPPSVNHYKKVGRLVKTKTGKLYQQRVDTNETKTFYYQVYMMTRRKIPLEWAKFAASATIKYEARICLYPPDYSRWDIDNRLKVLIDALVRAHLINDDSQIYRLYVEKCDYDGDGRAIVHLLPFE